MEINIKINPNVFNEAYLPYLNCNIRKQIFFGGASSGKSFAIVGQRTIYDMLKGDRNYLIVRNVARTSRQSTFNEVCKIISRWEVSKYFKINKSEMVITCINGYQILFAGLDDVEKLKSIVPAKGVLTDILSEEATETSKSDIKQLEKRLRGKSKVSKRLTLIFNPILKSHWIFSSFFSGRFSDNDTEYHDEQLSILKTTYKDNLRFLENDDVVALENENDDYFYNVYSLGNWGVLGDVIFTNWKIADLTELIQSFDNIRNGLDFGFSNDPTAFVRLHYDRMRKKIYIFDEFQKKSLTNPKIAIYLDNTIGNERIVCDSSEPKSIQELINCGIDAIGAIKGKDSVRFGIQWLQQHEIIIDRQCQDTINEFQLYQWKKDKFGESTNAPIDKHNHSCLVGETEIFTLQGKKLLKNITIDDYVYTRMGFKKVIDSRMTGIKDVYQYNIDGIIIKGTKDHKIFINKKGFVCLQDVMLCDIPIKINIGDIVKCHYQAFALNSRAILIDVIQKAIEDRIVFIFQALVQKATLYLCIEKFINFIMEKFRTDIISITEMGIRLIIRLKTSRLKKLSDIVRIIARNGIAKKKNLSKTISIEYDRLQKNGMLQKRGTNGINNMGSKLQQSVKRLNLFVLNVIKNLCQYRFGLNFVPIIASQPIEEPLKLTILQVYAQYAKNYSGIINIKNKYAVQDHAPIYLGQRKTYNLTVENAHEYFANGILVKNCDAIRYALEDDMDELGTGNIWVDGNRKTIAQNNRETSSMDW